MTKGYEEFEATKWLLYALEDLNKNNYKQAIWNVEVALKHLNKLKNLCEDD
jgi:hypothetical protein